MSKVIRQSCVLFAFVIVCLLLVQAEAKANDFVSTNFFFEQGDCEFLDGRAKRLCLLHCEFLECDEADSLGLGPFLTVFHERACGRLLDRYEQETGSAGPPCFCNEACDINYDECIEGCADDEDPACCEIKCGNTLSSCNAGCCGQQGAIDFNRCISECEGDPICESTCTISGCLAVAISCIQQGP